MLPSGEREREKRQQPLPLSKSFMSLRAKSFFRLGESLRSTLSFLYNLCIALCVCLERRGDLRSQWAVPPPPPPT